MRQGCLYPVHFAFFQESSRAFQNIPLFSRFMASLKVACSASLQPSGTQQGSFISMTHQITGAEVVFFITLAVTCWAAVLGWQHAKKHQQGGLAHQNLNRWFIGLSAGATANSGFVV